MSLAVTEQPPARGPLTPSQVESFFETGFVTIPNVFRRDEVARMRRAFDRLQETAYGLSENCMHRGSRFVVDPPAQGSGAKPRIHRVVWCGAAEPVLSRYGMDPRLLAAAGQLLGSRAMNQLINQAHFKLPGDGVEFPWHQDSTHRRYGGTEWSDVNGRGSYVQTVVAVDDVTPDNGPLRFIPGSCRLGHVPVAPGSGARLPEELIAGRTQVAPTMDAGSVLLFGPYTFHSSGVNRSSRPRRVFINGFAAPGANSRVYPGEGAGRLVALPG